MALITASPIEVPPVRSDLPSSDLLQGFDLSIIEAPQPTLAALPNGPNIVKHIPLAPNNSLGMGMGEIDIADNGYMYYGGKKKYFFRNTAWEREGDLLTDFADGISWWNLGGKLGWSFVAACSRKRSGLFDYLRPE